MIISVLNQKGGVGKTTIATHLAAGFSARGGHVLLVDADPQHSALDWGMKREQRPPFTLVGQPIPKLHRDLPPLVGDPYTQIIIDGPGKISDIPRSAVMASQVVLIPVQPSPYDVWATEDVLQIIGEAQAMRHDECRVAFVITMQRQGTILGRDIVEALAKFEVPTLRTQIYRRQSYLNAAGEGLSVMEAKPRDAKAVEEMMALLAEVEDFAHGR